MEIFIEMLSLSACSSVCLACRLLHSSTAGCSEVPLFCITVIRLTPTASVSQVDVSKPGRDDGSFLQTTAFTTLSSLQ